MKDVQSIINAMTVEELDKALLERKEYRKEKYPIITFYEETEGIIESYMEYVVDEWKNNLYLSSRCVFTDGNKSDWVQVEDLTELKVWEYNKLVDELNKHYPDYPIERLESRFV